MELGHQSGGMSKYDPNETATMGSATTDTVYCRNCGHAIPADAHFCPHCGAAQHPFAHSATDVPDWVAIMALIFFFPVGLILMWAGTRWSLNVKLTLTGFLFPPLWFVVLGRLLWRVPWSRQTKAIAVVATAAVLTLFFLGVGSSSAALWTVLVCVIVGVLWVMTAPTQRKSKQDPNANVRRAIESDLDTCNDLIVEIEDELTSHPLEDDDPMLAQYVRALEMRTQAVDLLEQAHTRPDLVAVETRAARAIDALRATRDQVTHSLKSP